MTGDVRLRLSCALLFACLPLMSVQLGGLGQPAFAPNLHTGAAGAAGAAAARPPVAPRPHSRRPRPFRTRPRPFAPTDGFLAAPVPGPKSETKSRYRYKQRKKNPNTHLHSSFSTTTPCFFVEQFPSHHRPCILFHNGADTTSCADTLVRTAPPLYLAIPATSNSNGRYLAHKQGYTQSPSLCQIITHNTRETTSSSHNFCWPATCANYFHRLCNFSVSHCQCVNRFPPPLSRQAGRVIPVLSPVGTIGSSGAQRSTKASSE